MSTDDRTHDPLGIGPGLRDLDTALRENEHLREENRALYRALRRLTDGMHTGDHQDAAAALAAASALIGSLAPLYEEADRYWPVGADQGAPRLRPGEER